MDKAAQTDYRDFVAAHWGSVYRTAYLLTGDHHLAEDLTQTGFTKAYVGWGRIRSLAAPVAYVRKIVVNETATRRRRRAGSEPPTSEVHDGACPGHDQGVTDHQAIRTALLTLPPRQRAVIVLRYFVDLTEADIARTLDMSPGTVKSHAAAARSRLAQLLGDEDMTANGGSLESR